MAGRELGGRRHQSFTLVIESSRMFELPPPDPAFEVSIASQGMSKGLRQTEDAQFLARGEVALGHAFVGLLWKNIDSTVASGEGQFYLGYRNRVASFDLTATAGRHWSW